MKKYSNRLLMTLFCMSLSMTVLSCGKIKRKGHQVLQESRVAAAEQFDRVIPSYDAGTPDTDNNKRRFKDHLSIDASADVKNLYTYGDYMGIDYRVEMAFTCDQATIDKIVKMNDLELVPDEPGDKNKDVIVTLTCDWWPKDSTGYLVLYKAGEEDEFWQYLTYNPVTKQAYYEEFSL